MPGDPPANGDGDPIEVIVRRAEARMGVILREAFAELREHQRCATPRRRTVTAPPDDAPVDELARAKARALLDRHGSEKRRKDGA